MEGINSVERWLGSEVAAEHESSWGLLGLVGAAS